MYEIDDLLTTFENLYCDDEDMLVRKIITYDLNQLADLYLKIINSDNHNFNFDFVIKSNPIIDECIEKSIDVNIVMKLHKFVLSNNLILMLQTVLYEKYKISIFESDIIEQLLYEYFMYIGLKD